MTLILILFNIAYLNTVDEISLLSGDKSINQRDDWYQNRLFLLYSEVYLIIKYNNGNFINDVITDDNGELIFDGLIVEFYNLAADKVRINNDLTPVTILMTAEPLQDT